MPFWLLPVMIKFYCRVWNHHGNIYVIYEWKRLTLNSGNIINQAGIPGWIKRRNELTTDAMWPASSFPLMCCLCRDEPDHQTTFTPLRCSCQAFCQSSKKNNTDNQYQKWNSWCDQVDRVVCRRNVEALKSSKQDWIGPLWWHFGRAKCLQKCRLWRPRWGGFRGELRPLPIIEADYVMFWQLIWLYSALRAWEKLSSKAMDSFIWGGISS